MKKENRFRKITGTITVVMMGIGLISFMLVGIARASAGSPLATGTPVEKEATSNTVARASLLGMDFTSVIRIAHAATPAAGAGTAAKDNITPDMQKMYEGLSRFLTFAMTSIQMVLWPILLLIGGLLKNDLLFGGGMEERMLFIWRNIRDLVNVLFVLVLLVIALYNVLGLKGADYQLKAILPKFVIALVAVNFSFMGLKVAIDGINVISTAIFAMPATIGVEGAKAVNIQDFDLNICKGLYPKTEGKRPSNLDPKDSMCDDSAKLKTDIGNNLRSFGGQNFALYMAVNYNKITSLIEVKQGLPTDLSNLALNIVVSVVLNIVYGASFIALFAVLVARLVVLWMTLVMSPLIALKMVLPQKLQQSIAGKKDLGEKFMKHAIAPIPIALTMTIGFIMMDALKSASFSDPAMSSTLGVGLMTSGISNLQELLIAMCTVGFVWMGVFDAAEGTIAEGFTKQVRGAVEGAGKFVRDAWQYVPMIPVQTTPGGKKENVSFGGAMTSLSSLPQQMMNLQTDKDRKIIGRMTGFEGADLGEAESAIKDKKYNAIDALGIAKGALGYSSSEADRKRMQKALGERFEKNNDSLTHMIDADGNRITDRKKFIAVLKEGKLDQTKWDDLMSKNDIKDKKLGESAGIPKEKQEAIDNAKQDVIKEADSAREKRQTDETAKQKEDRLSQLKSKIKTAISKTKGLKNEQSLIKEIFDSVEEGLDNSESAVLLSDSDISAAKAKAGAPAPRSSGGGQASKPSGTPTGYEALSIRPTTPRSDNDQVYVGGIKYRGTKKGDESSWVQVP